MSVLNTVVLFLQSVCMWCGCYMCHCFQGVYGFVRSCERLFCVSYVFASLSYFFFSVIVLRAVQCTQWNSTLGYLSEMPPGAISLLSRHITPHSLSPLFTHVGANKSGRVCVVVCSLTSGIIWPVSPNDFLSFCCLFLQNEEKSQSEVSVSARPPHVCPL